MKKVIGNTMTALLAGSMAAHGANILAPGDFIIGIGLVGSGSSYPGAEGPSAVLDGNSGSKYLNFAKENSGFIVTPSAPSTAESIRFTSANDAEERDPATFSIWGTNDVIRSGDNSLGDQENWTPIVSGAGTNLPTTRLSAGGAVDLSNGSSFSSYRVSFDSLRNGPAANSMQIADVQLFSGAGGAGTSILSAGDSIFAIDLDNGVGRSRFPDGENPRLAIDGNTSTKYLNFGGPQTGFIVTPAIGSSVIDGFTITTGNDAPGRDPVGYTLFGTNDAITSAENSGGTDENWVLIKSGTLNPPIGRGEEYGDVIDGNSLGYTSYRFDVDRIGPDSLMQFSEIQFTGAIPEPSSALLALFGLLPLARRRR